MVLVGSRFKAWRVRMGCTWYAVRSTCRTWMALPCPAAQAHGSTRSVLRWRLGPSAAPGAGRAHCGMLLGAAPGPSLRNVALDQENSRKATRASRVQGLCLFSPVCFCRYRWWSATSQGVICRVRRESEPIRPARSPRPSELRSLVYYGSGRSRKLGERGGPYQVQQLGWYLSYLPRTVQDDARVHET